MSKDTGGPAFPVTSQNYLFDNNDGMSLRDYFAAKAMQEFIAPSLSYALVPKGRTYAQHVATMAYEMADAMLNARGEK